MEKPPKPPASLGSTMRIDLSPEVLEEARRGRSRPATQPILSIPKPRPVTVPGSADFQQLLQNIYDAALITDLAGDVVMVNVRANQFFFALPGQLAHYSILTLIGGADETLLPMILETLKANRFVLLQAYCVRTNGSFFAAEVSVNRLRLADRDFLGFFIRDVTLRKEQEERLRTGNNALQNASSGIVITGLGGKIEYGNAAFLALFRLSALEQVQGHELHELLGHPAQAAEILTATAEGHTWSGELEMQRPDGSIFFAQASLAPNTNSEGELVGVVLSVLDITSSKIAQQQLQTYASELSARNAQMQEDLDLASELHRAFLPDGFGVFPPGARPEQVRLHVNNLYCPCGTIGGDFYDVRPISADEVGFFMADVMGHGIRSALVVATIRGLIEQLREVAGDPGAFMTRLNASYSAIFQQFGGTVIFATALYAIIDTRTGVLRCANASHPRPFVLRRDEQRVEQILATPERSAPLGIFAWSTYETRQEQLAPHDLLLLHTDGLAEVESRTGELYESGRFPQALQECLACPPEKLLDFLIDDAKAFSGLEVFEDDVCLLSVEVARLAAAPARGAPELTAAAHEI